MDGVLNLNWSQEISFKLTRGEIHILIWSGQNNIKKNKQPASQTDKQQQKHLLLKTKMLHDDKSKI